MATLTRRDFAKLTGAGAAALSLGGILAGCAGGGNEKPAAGTGATGTGDAAPSQVIVSMTTGSEPAAGFDPLVSWGCGEHVHEPLIQSTLIATDTDLSFKNDLATSYECSDDGMTWTLHHPRRRALHRRRAAHGARRGVYHQRHPHGRGLGMRPVHGARGRRTGRRHGGHPHEQAVQRASCTRLAVIGIVPEHAYGEAAYGANPIGSGPLYAGAVGPRPAGHPEGQPRLLRRSSRRSSAWWPCSWRRTPRSPRRSPAKWTWPTPLRRSPTQRARRAIRLAELRVGRFARHLAAHHPRRCVEDR